MATVQAEEEDSTMAVEDMDEDPATTTVDPMEMEHPSHPHTSFTPMVAILKGSNHSKRPRSAC